MHDTRDHLTVGGSSPLPANGPVEARDIGHQIGAADLILVGMVTEVKSADGPVSLVSERADAANDRLQQAKLAVVRTIVGGPNAGLEGTLVNVLFLEGTIPSQPWMVLRPGQTVMLFLHVVGDAYRPVVPEGSLLRTLPDIDPLPHAETRAKAVAYELEQIILRADPISEAELIVEASTARVEVQGSVDLGLLSTSVLQEPVRRTAWVAIALADGKIEVLPEVEVLCAEPVLWPMQTLQDLVLLHVRKTRDPAACPYLAILSRSISPELAYAATVALRQLHDPVTIPDLIAALEYPEQRVRYQAVMGLAELNPDAGPGPAFRRYHENESQYLHHWQQWWRSR